MYPSSSPSSLAATDRTELGNILARLKGITYSTKPGDGEYDSSIKKKTTTGPI